MLKGNISRHMKKFHPTNSSVMITPMKRDSQENRGEYRLEQHKCKLCKIPASSVDELRVHSSEVHNLDYDDIEQMLADEDDDEEIPFNRMIEEKQTDKVSVKRKTRDEFLRDSSPKKEQERFQCFYCDKDFSMEQSRKRHVKQSHEEMLEKYVERTV